MTLPAAVNLPEVYRYLGYGKDAQPDGETCRRLDAVCTRLLGTARPHGVWRALTLAETQPLWQGGDIARHLAGCDGCVLLAVTLGVPTDALLRALSAADVADAVLADAAASVLTEQLAQQAEDAARAEAARQGRYLTGRFSPGYGDFPIAVQPQLLRLLDAPRAIGLCASASCLLTPRKSVTAVCGTAAHPVTGRLAGCAHCALRTTCAYRKQGRTCSE